MKEFFSFLQSFVSNFFEWLKNRKHEKETRNIRLPILTQQDPLVTDETSVRNTISRMKEFMQELKGPISTCGIIREQNGICKMHLIISETLTPEQESTFREIVGNTAIDMNRGVLYLLSQ